MIVLNTPINANATIPTITAISKVRLDTPERKRVTIRREIAEHAFLPLCRKTENTKIMLTPIFRDFKICDTT